jgi:transmembrane sensor
VEDQAAEWLLRRDFFDWSEEDRKALDAWLAASVSNRVAFWRLNAALSRTERLAALRKPMRKTQASLHTPWPRHARSIAAVAAVAIAVTGSYLLTPRSKDETISTALGGHKIVSLADGSRIELNTSSAVRVRIDAERRAVTLIRGEAYFDIRHDAAHPFTVDAQGQRITDLGTKFVVRNLKDRVEVALLEGAAHLAPMKDGSPARGTDLKPGDIATATARGVSVIRAPEDAIAAQLGRRNGTLIFRNTALAEVADQFNRYNQGKLIVEGPASGLRVDGTFPANDPQTFTRIAGDILHLTVKKRGDDIVLSR